MYSSTTYWVRALSQSLGQSKTKGTPQFSLRILVLGKCDPANPGGELISCDQAERTIYLSFASEESAAITIEQLRAIGWNRTSFRTLDPNFEGFHDFTDKEFEAYCKHSEYNGKPQEQWSVSRPRPEAVPLPPEEARKLDALYGKMLKNGATKAPAQRAVKPLTDPSVDPALEGAKAAAEDDPEIPF